MIEGAEGRLGAFTGRNDHLLERDHRGAAGGTIDLLGQRPMRGDTRAGAGLG